MKSVANKTCANSVELALRLVLPALAASTIATQVATFVIPNAPLYSTPAYVVTPQTYVWAVLAAPILGIWSVAFVRLIAWADRVRPSDWRRLVAPAPVFLAVGLISIPFPQVLGNGQDVAQLLFRQPMAPLALLILLPVRPLCTVGLVASGGPGGLFTPTLAAGALACSPRSALSGSHSFRMATSVFLRSSARARWSRRRRRGRSPRS